MNVNEKVLLCREDEYGVWHCRNEKETLNFVDYDEYDIVYDLLLATANDIGGYRDVNMAIDMLKNWQEKSKSKYDDIIGEIEECDVDNKFYCIMNGIENVAKESLIEYTEKKYGEEFADYIRDEVDDVGMYYNYIDWGCEYGGEICEAVESLMRNGYGEEYEYQDDEFICKTEVPSIVDKILDEEYKEFQEEYGEEEWE